MLEYVGVSRFADRWIFLLHFFRRGEAELTEKRVSSEKSLARTAAGAEKGRAGPKARRRAHRREVVFFIFSLSFCFLFQKTVEKHKTSLKARSPLPLPLLFLQGKTQKSRGEALPSLLLSSLSLSPSGVGHLVAEKLKLALLFPHLSLLLQAAEGKDAPGLQPPPLPLRQRLPVDEDHGLGTYVRDEERRAGPHLLRCLCPPDLLELLFLRRGLLLLLDRELHAPEPEEARERDVVGGPPGVGDGDKVLGAERGWGLLVCFRGRGTRGLMIAGSTEKNGEPRNQNHGIIKIT